MLKKQARSVFLPNVNYINKFLKCLKSVRVARYIFNRAILMQQPVCETMTCVQTTVDKKYLRIVLRFLKIYYFCPLLIEILLDLTVVIFQKVITFWSFIVGSNFEYPKRNLLFFSLLKGENTLFSNYQQTPLKIPSRRKITTTISLRFNRNYTICFLLKPTHTSVFNVIWSGRITCFYKLVSPTYSKVHLKKYKKFLDLLVLSVYKDILAAKLITNLSLITPNILDASSVISKRKYQITNSPKTELNQNRFRGFGFLSIHGDFFKSLKVRRGLPRRIRRKVLSKKVGRL